MTGPVLGIVFILGSLTVLTFEYTNLQLNTSFRQRLTVLAPKLSEQEHKEFLASWAAMHSRKDFDAITDRMNTLAQARNVVLPEPLMNAH